VPGGAASRVDPNTCGNYAASDAGRKLKAFLQATTDLNDAVIRTEQVVKTSCVMMGEELGMAPGQLSGKTRDVCALVINTIKENLKVSLKAGAQLTVDYKPAVCQVNIDAAARAAAECEAKAQGDVQVTCSGQCEGTCSGTCAGECHGKTGAGGKCEGHCQGTCQGSCSGGCVGNADVKASAECKAQAEVRASVDVECTPAEVNISARAGVIIDTAKAELTIRALKRGLPEILSVRARLKPLQAAVITWASSAKNLVDAGGELVRSFGDQALCISGQLAAAARMIGSINASIEVSVSVSVSASGSSGIQ
jgi:hypothetical protein